LFVRLTIVFSVLHRLTVSGDQHLSFDIGKLALV